jgi:RNA polymerase sigma-70 factor (ECF subfamily)
MPIERPAPLRLVSSNEGPLTLEQAFRRYSPYVAKVALRLLGRDSEVDDVVQDVFLIAIKGLAALREQDAIKGWLATVTVRVVRKKLRARRVKAWLRLDDAPDYADVAAPGATAEERALLSRVYAVLDAQSADERIAWTLRNVEREKLEDIAEICGCSLATVKRRVSAAQEAIEEALGR